MCGAYTVSCTVNNHIFCNFLIRIVGQFIGWLFHYNVFVILKRPRRLLLVWKNTAVCVLFCLFGLHVRLFDFSSTHTTLFLIHSFQSVQFSFLNWKLFGVQNATESRQRPVRLELLLCEKFNGISSRLKYVHVGFLLLFYLFKSTTCTNLDSLPSHIFCSIPFGSVQFSSVWFVFSSFSSEIGQPVFKHMRIHGNCIVLDNLFISLNENGDIM